MKVTLEFRTLTALVGAAVVLGGGSLSQEPEYVGQAIVELVPGADIGPINAEFGTVLLAYILDE